MQLENDKLLKAIPWVLLVVLGLGALGVAWSNMMREEQTRLDNETLILESAFNHNFTALLEVSPYLDSLFAASQAVTAEEFHIFAQPLLNRMPFLKSIAYLPRVRSNEVEAFTRGMRSQGFLHDGLNQPTPGDVFPVKYIEPLSDEWTQTLGYNYFAHTEFRQKAMQAIEGATPLWLQKGLVCCPKPAYSMVVQAGYAGKGNPVDPQKLTPKQRRETVNALYILSFDENQLIQPKYTPQNLELKIEVFRHQAKAQGHPLLSVSVPTKQWRLPWGQIESVVWVDGSEQDFRISAQRSLPLAEVHFGEFLLALGVAALLVILGTFLLRAQQRYKEFLLARNKEIEIQVSEQTGSLANRTIALQATNQQLLETEAELFKSKRMVEMVLDSIPVRVYWKDTNLKYLGANRLFAQDAGVASPSDLIGKSDFDLVWKAYAESYAKRDQEVMESKRPRLNYIEPQISEQGRESWLEMSQIPLTSAEGEVVGILGVYTEITERILAQRALQEHTTNLNQVQSMAHVGNWTWDIATGEVQWSDEIFRIFGFEPGAFTPSYERFLQAIPVADQHLVKEGIEQALKQNQEYAVNHRIIRPNGETRHLFEKGEVFFASEGKPLRMRGFIQDITEHKLAE